MANLDVYRFETEDDRAYFLRSHGYKTTSNCLVNVLLSEDEHEEKPYMVKCLIDDRNSYPKYIDSKY